MFGTLDVSMSGMVAQRTRLEAIAANIANQSAILDAEGNVNPYRRKLVEFSPGDPSARTGAGRAMGVHVSAIVDDASEFPLRFEPGNPHAFKEGRWKGYVPGTNVNPVVEQINAVEASRAYEANVAAAEASKAMIAQALRLLA